MYISTGETCSPDPEDRPIHSNSSSVWSAPPPPCPSAGGADCQSCYLGATGLLPAPFTPSLRVQVWLPMAPAGMSCCHCDPETGPGGASHRSITALWPQMASWPTIPLVQLGKLLFSVPERVDSSSRFFIEPSNITPYPRQAGSAP